MSDWTAHAIVVFNQVGQFRSKNSGLSSSTKETFYPYSHILIADCDSNCIHILDLYGQFFRYIDLINPYGFCVDTKDNLFVAEDENVKKRKFSITCKQTVDCKCQMLNNKLFLTADILN